MGLPGAGKSTLARSLSRTRLFARVDRDALRAALFPGLPVSAAQKRAANAAVWRAVSRLLRQRRSVIVDGMTFASASQRRQARVCARRGRAMYREVFLDCPTALARARVRQSSDHPATDRTAALVDEVARRFAPVSRAVLRLDARRPVRALVREARSRL